jgi:serine/threonine-protein kinase
MIPAVMLCPVCNAENLENAAKCKSCTSPLGLAFSSNVAENPTDFPRKRVENPTFVPEADFNSATGFGNSSSASSSDIASGVITVEIPDFGPRYRVVSKLGEGGMGAVYRAKDLELSREVALKLVRPALMQNATVLKRFKQELLLASKISHKNVLRIHDLAEANGLKFISMAYVDGQDLAAMIRANGKLSVAQAVDIAAQICSALVAAHSEGVIHRDLKPENILIQNGSVYVSDFGLAKSLEESQGIATAMTMSGELLGTPRYMAPEQVQAKPADGRTDIYALGLILYEMVTGDVPFHGDSAFHVMLARIQQDPVNPKNLNSDVPDYLAKIILRCLERDPRTRYQSAQELLDDLNAHRATRSTFSGKREEPLLVAPQPTTKTRTWTIVSVICASLIAILLLAGAGYKRFRAQKGNTATAFYIGVLPFRADANSPNLNIVAQGMNDSLNAKLFQLTNVHLASQSAAARLSPDANQEQAAQELGAKILVGGSVQGAGDRVRIVINAWDADKKDTIWKQEYSGVAADLLTLEDQVYNGLSQGLKLNTTSEEQTRIASQRPSENADAYQLYLQGRNDLRRTDDLDKVRHAVSSFDAAVKADPSFALAYAGLAEASMVEYRKTFDNADSLRAVNAAERAQQLGNDLPEVHLTLGMVYSSTGKINEAAAELKQAITLAPNSDDAYRQLCKIYLRLNRPSDAYDAVKKAIELNPYLWLNYYQAYQAYLATGKYGDAEAMAKKVMELDPKNSVGPEALGNIYLKQGKYDLAIPQYQLSLQLKPAPSAFSNLGTSFFYLNRYDEAAQAYLEAVKLNPRDQINLGNLADTYRAMKRTDDAKTTYSKAISLALDQLKTNPRDTNALGSLALYNAKSGNIKDAIRFIQQARKIDQNDLSQMYNEALVYTLAGDHDNAIRALQEAVAHGSSVRAIQSDPEFAPLKGDPQFQGLGAAATAKK